MAREYFCAYHSLLEAMELLEDAECGRLFKAALIYSQTGEPPELQGNERFVFSGVRAQIDRDKAKYNEFSEKQSQNGKKGGRPSKATESQKNQAFFEEPKKAKEKEKEKEKAKENVPPIPPKGESAFTYDQYRQAFISLCPSLPEPEPVTSWTSTRKKALRSKNVSLEDFRDVCKKIERSDFLTGRNGKWTSCAFDWILKPANWVKILEGNYDNRSPSSKPTTYDIDAFEASGAFDTFGGS